MVKSIISSLLLVVTLSIYAQENPMIDKKEFLSSSREKKTIKKAIKEGDFLYKNGLYDVALQQYMKLYEVKDDNSPLNYKIAVSHLYSLNPMNALAYIERSSPDVATDYLYQKGIAHIYHRQYDDAKVAFRQYTESLPPKEANKVMNKIKRFLEVCDFSATAVQDSLPVFIINAGPMVNSYYDDYSAVELLSPSSTLYFTSRRPDDNNKDISTHSGAFRERIFYSPEFNNEKANEAEATRLKSSKHMSVAGMDNNTGSLLYYKGKKRFGDVYRTQFKENGKTTKNKRLKKTISKKNTTEGAVSIADNGDAYFISKRPGGIGGKDIWYAKKKGKKSFYVPQNLSDLNTPLNEECVFVAPDGKTLYFSSNGLPGMGGYDIYKSVKMSNGTWGKPVNMGYPINDFDDDLFYRLTSDSTLALLSSKRIGGFGGLDIFFVKKDMRIPFELSGNVTDEKTGKTLEATVKIINRNANLSVVTAVNDTLLQRYVLNLENIGNYYLQAEAPGYHSRIDSFVNPTTRNAKLHHDFVLEKILRPYALDGYVTDLRTKKPVLAEILIKPSGKDNVLYRTVTDNFGYYTLKIDDKDNFDLTARATNYFDYNEGIPLTNVVEDTGSKNITLQRSIGVYMVTGMIIGEKNAEPLKANISVNKLSGDQSMQRTVSGDNGKYELTLSDTGPFLMEVTSEGYFFTNSALQFSDDSTLVVRNFILKKMESGAKMVIENILFNSGKATMLPASYASLNKLVNLLKENPKVKIEVSGHTDNVGSAATNKTLSKNRALSVREYLVKQGIAADRVKYEGYGFERPIAPNTTADGRAANRRVEIEILD